MESFLPLCITFGSLTTAISYQVADLYTVYMYIQLCTKYSAEGPHAPSFSLVVGVLDQKGRFHLIAWQHEAWRDPIFAQGAIWRQNWTSCLQKLESFDGLRREEKYGGKIWSSQYLKALKSAFLKVIPFFSKLSYAHTLPAPYCMSRYANIWQNTTIEFYKKFMPNNEFEHMSVIK